MSTISIRVALNDFDTGTIKLFKDIKTPYSMDYSADIPFNTVFLKDSRHFAMIGISKSIAGYSSGLGV